MSENWKARVRIGSIWGASTAILSSLMEFFEHESLGDIFFTYKFLLKLLVFIVFGVLFFGYAFTKNEKHN